MRLLSGLLLVPSLAMAQFLLADVETRNADSQITALSASGGRASFGAYAGITGLELFRSDGTAGGTTLVADLTPGPASSAFDWTFSTGPNSVFVAANDQLYFSNGTVVGTIVLVGTTTDTFVALGQANAFFFFGRNNGTVTRLFRTDGTVVGTVELPAGQGATLQAGAWLGFNTFYFYFFKNSRELWRTDGTNGGTTLVFDSGQSVTYPPPTLVGGQSIAYFNIGNSLFRTDGAAGAGTFGLRAFTSLTMGSILGTSNVLFFGGTGPNGKELWRSDGTVVGTVEFLDLTPGATSTSLGTFSSNSTSVFFVRGNATFGYDLMATNGTVGGTVTLGSTVNTGIASLSQPLSNGIVFANASGSLMLSNGTVPGTQTVSLNPTTIAPVVAGGTVAFFIGTQVGNTNGLELYKSDGTAIGTTLTREIYPGTVPFPASQPLYVTFDEAWLWAGSSSNRAVLDGRAGNITRLVFNLNGPYGTVGRGALLGGTSEPLIALPDAGLVNLGDVSPGGTVSTFLRANVPAVDLGSVTVFVAASVPQGMPSPYDYELFRTDGTATGTQALLDVRPGSTSSAITRFERVGARAFFNANDGVTGDELWVTDGTVMGTRQVVDLVPGATSSSPTALTRFGAGALFLANEAATGTEAWFSDGTSVGTVRLVDSFPGPTSGIAPVGFPGFCVAAARGSAYFVANGALYETNGTAAGTRVVGASASRYACAGDRVFSLRDGGVEVFDGTSTWRLASPVALGTAEDVVGVGTTGFVRGTSPSTGRELWRITDGGASLLALSEIGLGAVSGVRAGAFDTYRLRDRFVFFGANDGTDYEPWAVAIDGTRPVITSSLTGTLGQNGWYTSNVGVSFTVSEPDSRLATGNCGAATISQDTPGTTITCVAVSEGGEASTSVTFKRDATPPVATVLTPANGGSTNQRRPFLSVNASEAATLTTTVGASTSCTAAGDAGTLGCTASSDLPVGVNVVSYALVDQAGNASAPVTSTFTIDLVAPGAPAFTAPTPGQRVRALSFSGTAEANATVRVFEGGTLVCTTTADATGAWSCTAVSGAERTVIVTAEAEDGATNVSTRSPSLTVTLDLTAPAAPLVTMPQGGSQLSVARPTVTGTCEAGAHVSVFVDGSVAPDCEVDAPAGTFSCQLTTALGNGPHSVAARARDSAGNDSAPSNTVSFTVSTTVPAAPVITLPAPMSVIRDARPTFTGTATAALVVRVFLDGAMQPGCSATADAAGAWQCGATVSLSEGAHVATATATDSFGTESAMSSAAAFTLDSTPPPPPVITQPVASSTTGLRPTIAGTAEANARVSVFLDGAATTTCAVTATNGAWTCAPTADLVAGPHSLQAKATDLAGNESALSGVLLFTAQSSTDTRAPTIVCPMDITAQASASGSAIVNFQATVSDDVDLTPSLRYSQSPGTDFLEGDTTVLVTAQDASGNTSQCSFVVKVTQSSERNTIKSGCRCSGVSADAFMSLAGVLLLLARSRRRH